MPEHAGTTETAAAFVGARPRLSVTILLGVVVAVLYVHYLRLYAFLGDDCFISFRYARNLVEGHGLVFNIGERVEGYTNFLWVLIIAAFIRLEIPPEITSQVIGALSGALILALLAWTAARQSGLHNPLIWIAPLALATNRTFAAWSTGGLETQFFTLLVLAGALRLCIERERDESLPWGSALLFALATLTRPEGVLFAGAAGLAFAFDVAILRRRKVSALLLWGVVFAIPVTAHLVWRLAYYGYPLPNTFYAKISGLWPEQGMAYMRLFAWKHSLKWCLPILPLGWALRRDFLAWLSALFLVAWFGYMLWSGGDRFEFRFMAPVMPFLFLLLADAIRKGLGPWGVTSRWRGLKLAAAVVLSALVLWAGFRPNTLEHRYHRGIATLEAIEEYADRRAEEGKFLRKLVDEGFLTGNELIAVGGAGALPYYSRMPILDIRGLNDVSIAHQDIDTRREIGHEKAASLEYLTARGVVVIDVLNRLVLAESSPEPQDRWAETDYYAGPLRCVAANGRYLTFATTLDEQNFRRVFARFEVVF